MKIPVALSQHVRGLVTRYFPSGLPLATRLAKVGRPKGKPVNQPRVGIEISATSVKIVQALQTNGTIQVLHSASAPLPRLSDPTVPRNPTEVAPLLKALIESEKIQPREVVSAFEPSQLFLKEIKLPKIPEAELAKAIVWEAERHLPFPKDDAVVEFQTVEGSQAEAQEMTVILVAARKAHCLAHLEALRQAHMRVLRIDASCCGVARTMSHLFPQETVATLDIGASGACLIIQKGPALRLMRRLEIGGDRFTQAIAQAKGISFEEAEQMKVGRPSGEATPELDEAVSGLIAELARQLTRSIAFVQAQFPDEAVNQLILCGGGSLSPGLNQRLAEGVGMSVKAADPFQLGPRFVGCLGLALQP